MVITFEGAPAVGKSTIAGKLSDLHGCYTVPEVNKLFGKENRISDLWYYQKQVERWNLAINNQVNSVFSILDGDIFQPIWFSVLFPNENWGSFKQKVDFYSEMLDRKNIDFPNKYVYFHIAEGVRAEREIERSLLLGRSEEAIERKISRYSDFASLQGEYFADLQKEFPALVVFLELSNVDCSSRDILSFSESAQYPSKEIFQFMVDWVAKREKC